MKQLFKILMCLVLAVPAAAQNRPVVGPVVTFAPAVGVVPVTSRGAASQTASLFEGITSAGAVLYRVDAQGNVWVQNTAPQFRLSDTDAGGNEKLWRLQATGTLACVATRTDADGAGQNAWCITRSGTAVTAQAWSLSATEYLKLDTTNGVESTQNVLLSGAGTLLRFYGATSASGAFRGNTVGGLGVTESRGADNAAYADHRVLDEAYGVGWNGNIAVPTKNAVYDKIEALTSQGLALQFSAATTDPADATTYYAGDLFSLPLQTTDSVEVMYVPKAGTLKSAFVVFLNTGAGTNEASSVYVRVNSTTDTLISAAVDNSVAGQTISNGGLSVAVAAGDTVELKWVTPTWATEPTGVFVKGLFYIE